MRHLKQSFVLILMTGLTFAITSCEELFGEWEKPVVVNEPSNPVSPTNDEVTCNITGSDILFATGDKLYVSGSNISGILELQAGAGTTSATFSGSLNYTGSGTPSDDLALNATLVTAQQTVGTEVSVDANGVVTVNYPTTSYCANVTEAGQKYSRLTGTSTYGAKSFSLSQQTTFLNFVITFDDGTNTDTSLSAVVSNSGDAIATGNVTTVTESGKVVAKFVLPLASGTTLTSAIVKMGNKQTIALDDATLAANVSNMNKIQPPHDLSAIQSANCYLVPAKGKYRFKATVKGNGSADLGGISKTTDASTINSAELVWATFNTTVAPAANELIKDISYENGYVYFSTGDTYKEGNALVAIKDNSNNILWSWHLWFESDDLEALAQTYPNSNYVMMDRNLGALTNCYSASDALDFGFAYQNGRKDPFMMSATRTTYTALGVLGTYTTAEGGQTVAASILKPTVVFGTDSWGGDPSLWSSTSKTIFDPCPPGWHIAPSDAWSASGFNSTTFKPKDNDFSTYHGWVFNDVAWFPATGDRWGSNHNNTGSFIRVWAQGSGKDLACDNGTKLYNVAGAGSNPGHGYSVRPIKE